MNPLVPRRVQKIKIHKLTLTDFYWLNLQKEIELLNCHLAALTYAFTPEVSRMSRHSSSVKKFVKKVKIGKNIRDKHGEKNCPIKFSLK